MISVKNFISAVKAALNGTATAADVLKGKTFYSTSAETQLTGTMNNAAEANLIMSETRTDEPIIGNGSSGTDIRAEIVTPYNKTTGGPHTTTYFAIRMPSSSWYMPANSYLGMTVNAIGTATVDQVLKGKTFTSSSGVKLSGTMANNGAVSQTIAPGASYTVPKGYHNGSGKVTASAIAVGNFSNGNSAKSTTYVKTYTLTTTEAYAACIIVAVACHGIEGDGTLTLSISGGGTLTSMKTEYVNYGTYGVRTSIYKGASVAKGAKITLTDSIAGMSGSAIYIIKAA